MAVNRSARLRRHVRRMANINQYIKTRSGGDARVSASTYRCRCQDLRPVFGRACVERCLRTDSLKVARIRRDDMLPEIRAMFDRASAPAAAGRPR